MKNILFYLAVALFALSCRTQKIVRSNTTTKEQTKTETIQTGHQLIDTTVTEKGEVQIVQIEFDTDTANQTADPVTIGTAKFAGRVKKATITTIIKAKESKGITRTDTATTTRIDAKIDNTAKIKTTQTKTTRWGWIFGILLLASGAAYWIYRKIESI